MPKVSTPSISIVSIQVRSAKILPFKAMNDHDNTFKHPDPQSSSECAQRSPTARWYSCQPAWHAAAQIWLLDSPIFARNVSFLFRVMDPLIKTHPWREILTGLLHGLICLILMYYFFSPQDLNEQINEPG